MPGFHTVSPGEGVKCTAGLTSSTRKPGCLPTGQDGQGLPGCSEHGPGLQRNYSKDQACCLLFPVMARVSCAKRYGYPLSCPFVQQKQKPIKVNVRSCSEASSGLRKLGGQRNFQGLADYADKAHLGVVCLATYACFSVIRVKKATSLRVIKTRL